MHSKPHIDINNSGIDSDVDQNVPNLIRLSVLEYDKTNH